MAIVLKDFSRLFHLKCSYFVLMKDYSEKYRNVTFFGIWAEEYADDYGRRDAWEIIRDALKRTKDEDVKSDELEAALCFLERYKDRKRPYQDFRKALNIHDPNERYWAMKDAMQRIWKGL